MRDLPRDAPDGHTGALGPGDRDAAEALVVDIDGFEGPLDLLLTLARRQKVDLRRISILQLAEQYLAVIEAARRLRLDLAADWLVTAAWLAYLKSRLLLPVDPAPEGPSAEDMAARLALRLQRLEAMREAGARLMARPQLGRELMPRGAPQVTETRRVTLHDARLSDLLRAYARLRTRDDYRPLHLDRPRVLSAEAALERLSALLGETADWRELSAFLPPDWTAPGPRRRSGMAATFAAALELVRRGDAELRQSAPFAEITLRPRPLAPHV